MQAAAVFGGAGLLIATRPLKELKRGCWGCRAREICASCPAGELKPQKLLPAPEALPFRRGRQSPLPHHFKGNRMQAQVGHGTLAPLLAAAPCAAHCLPRPRIDRTTL